MKTSIAEAIQQTQRHNFHDGLIEVFIGTLAILGSFVLAIAKSPFLAFGVFVLALVLITKTLTHLKERYVYPRSGYLTYKEHKSKLWVTLLIAMIYLLAAAALIILALLYDYDHALAWPSLIVGVFMGGTLLYKGIQLQLTRIILLGVLTFLLGCIFSPVVLDSGVTEGYNGLTTFGLFLFLVGAAFLISGGFRFRKSRQEKPWPVEATDD